MDDVVSHTQNKLWMIRYWKTCRFSIEQKFVYYTCNLFKFNSYQKKLLVIEMIDLSP